MMKSVEARVEPNGEVHLVEPLHLVHPCRAIVTILDDGPIPETALLSEEALAKDWQQPDEDAAWARFQ